jgi:hypothetical protein
MIYKWQYKAGKKVSKYRGPQRKLIDGREHDGPMNIRRKFEHTGNQLRWQVPVLSGQGRTRAQICEATTLPRRTVNRILLNFRLRGGVWGTHHKYPRRDGNLEGLRMQEQHFKAVQGILREKAVSTLVEVVHELYLQTGSGISTATLAIALARNGYTWRRLSRLHRAAFPHERVLFFSRAREWVTNLDQLVFIDETSKNKASINRMYGWGPSGQSVYNKGFVLNGRRMSVVGAYTSAGLLAMDMIPNTYTRQEFEQWFDLVLVPLLRPYPQANSIVVVDSARIHNMNHLRAACFRVGAVLLTQPRYSPDTNPIEKYWACTKKYLRKYGGYHPGNDNNQSFLLEALDHAHNTMHHIGNLASCGWYLLADGHMDPLAVLHLDLTDT